MTTPLKGSNKQPRKEEAVLDRRIQSLLGTGPDNYSSEQWRSLREQMRLPLLYPGQFVAYKDHYEGEGDERRLTCREVLCASRSLSALNKLLEQLPLTTRDCIQVSRVDNK